MADFRDTTSPYPNMIPTQDQFVTHLTNLGVGSSKPIVCYDQLNNVNASRAAFVLKTFGLPNVKVLDGGLKAWGVRATDSEEVFKDDKNLEVNFDPSTLVYYDEILKLIDGEAQIVDGRPASAF